MMYCSDSYENNNKGGKDDMLLKKELRLKISCEDLLYLQEIVEKGKNHSLRGYHNLTDEKKQEILGETFLRKMFVEDENPLRRRKILEKKGEEIFLYSDVKILCRGNITSDGKCLSVEETLTITVNPIIITNLRIEGNTLIFTLTFNESSINRQALIDSIPNKHKKTHQKKFNGKQKYYIDEQCLKGFDYWIEKFVQKEKLLQKNTDNRKILSMFFETLKSNHLTKMSGRDAVNFAHIYKNANEYYPDFKRLSFEEKMNLFHKIFKQARQNEKGNRELELLAMETIQLFLKEGLIKEFVCWDFMILKKNRYKLITAHSKDGSFRWVLAESMKGVRNGKNVYSLWRMLIIKSENEFLQQEVS